MTGQVTHTTVFYLFSCPYHSGKETIVLTPTPFTYRGYFSLDKRLGNRIQIKNISLWNVQFVSRFNTAFAIKRCASQQLKQVILREDGRERRKKKWFTSKASVRIAKKCDISLEKAAIDLRPRAAISKPRSQSFSIRASQLANNIFILTIGCMLLWVFKLQQMVYFKYLILVLWIHLAWPSSRNLFTSESIFKSWDIVHIFTCGAGDKVFFTCITARKFGHLERCLYISPSFLFHFFLQKMFRWVISFHLKPFN